MDLEQNYSKIINSPQFRLLVKRRWLVSIILTLTILFVYFGFILIVAFNKNLLSAKIGKHISLGIPVGISIIVFAWILTGIYVFWANMFYDKSVSEIKDKLLKDNSK